MQNDQWFARTLYPSNGLAKSNDFWEDMDDYTNKYIEVLKDNEDEQVEKIHDDHTGPGVPKFVGKYTHGMQEHENELVNDTRNLRNQEKKEAKRREGSDNPDSVLRRVDQYAKKEMAVIDRNEKKQKNRIHQDHNSKGTPSSIHDQNHEYDDHTETMKDDIRDVQRRERDDIRRKLGKSRNTLTLMDVYNNAGDVLSKAKNKKKKKWPSFDTQSHQIARREGVSEEDADAMLASRARNHGTKKSLANMSLVDIYHSKNSTADIDALIKRLIIPGNGSTHPEDIAQDDLRRQGVFKINSTKEGPVLYDTKPEPLPSVDRPPTKFRKPKATSTATMIPLSEAVSKPGGSAMSADMKSRLAEVQRRAKAEDAAESRTSSRPPSTDTDDSEKLTDEELGRMFEAQHNAESQVKPAPSRPFSVDDIKKPEDLTSADLRRIFQSLQTKSRGIRRKKSLSTAQRE